MYSVCTGIINLETIVLHFVCVEYSWPQHNVLFDVSHTLKLIQVIIFIIVKVSVRFCLIIQGTYAIYCSRVIFL